MRHAPHGFWTRHKGILRFWVQFVAAFVALEALLEWGGPGLWGGLTVWTARLTAWSISLLGDIARADGSRMHSTILNINIIGECTALHPMMMYLAAVLAYPAGWKPRMLGIGIGTPSIFLMNVVRVVSLCYIGHFWPSAFETAHKFVWQSLIIFFTALSWILWANIVPPRYEHRTP